MICEEDPKPSHVDLRAVGKVVRLDVEDNGESITLANATLHDSARARQRLTLQPHRTVQYSLNHEPSSPPPLALSAAVTSSAPAASSSAAPAPAAESSSAAPAASRLPADRRRRPLLRSATTTAAPAASVACPVATTYPHAEQHRRAQWPQAKGGPAWLQGCGEPYARAASEEASKRPRSPARHPRTHQEHHRRPRGAHP